MTAAALGLTSAQVATATEDSTVDRVLIEVAPSGSAPTSELSLAFDEPVSVDAAERELTSAFGDFSDMSAKDGTLHLLTPPANVIASDLTGRAPSSRTAGYHAIHCNSSYAFSDADGRFSVQRRCGTKLAPWGYRFSSVLRSICVNYTVNERALDWWRNGVKPPRQSAHYSMGCGYQFHSTLNPVPKGSLVRYNDHFTFRHKVGGGGSATLDIDGKLEFLGSL